ncbi:SH3 domain-containing protein [Chitinibacter sp. SCUT-21]|uniref:SH3 domain-containing protein n=1 Tax=Chitinibacter sp. SCUT-21 TaxID=2970891 RepID=UPI0035A72439
MKKALYCMLLASGVALADPGTVIRTTDLRDKPFLDASKIATVTNNTQIDIRSRKGAWMEVKLPNGQVGWIKLLNVRTSSGTSSSNNALANVIKTGSSGKTVTTGVKGLSAEQINNAVPNPAEMRKMATFAASPSDAQRTALANNLSKNTVPAINSTSTSGPNNTMTPMRR